MTEIIPGLYMSDLAQAESRKTHEYYGITHVVSVMNGNVMLPKTNRPGPSTLQIPIRDTPFDELAAHLPHTTAFIAEALRSGSSSQPHQPQQHRVLVHCVQGMSRSASVVAAYLIAAYGWSVTDAVAFVRSRAPGAQPNSGFMAQLQEYHDALRGKQKQAFR